MDAVATAIPAAKNARLARIFAAHGQELVVLGSLLALMALSGAVNARFLSENNLNSIFSGNAYVAVAAIGMSMVIIAGHIDTVSPGQREDWSTDPFGAELRDGRLYGRGSLDMKGGVVAGLAALRALVDTETELLGEAVLVTVPSEEDGGAGMLAARLERELIVDASVEPPRDAEIPMDAPVRGALDLLAEPIPA